MNVEGTEIKGYMWMYSYYYLIMYIKWYGTNDRAHDIVVYIEFTYYLHVYSIFYVLKSMSNERKGLSLIINICPIYYLSIM